MAPSGPDKPTPVPLERERELTIQLLTDHFAQDNLSVEELERRIALVFRATSVPALRDLTSDLVSQAPEAEPARKGGRRGRGGKKDAIAAPGDAPLPEAFAPESDRIVSVMAQTRRRGVWQLPRHLDLWSVMSETHLDLTEARLSPGVTEIHLRAVMATVKVIVPPGVRVVVQPSAFMAEVSDEVLSQPPVGSQAPVVRITGPVFMAELKVRVRTRELQSGAGDDLEENG
jgi:hypothetical protein